MEVFSNPTLGEFTGSFKLLNEETLSVYFVDWAGREYTPEPLLERICDEESVTKSIAAVSREDKGESEKHIFTSTRLTMDDKWSYQVDISVSNAPLELYLFRYI